MPLPRIVLEMQGPAGKPCLGGHWSMYGVRTCKRLRALRQPLKRSVDVRKHRFSTPEGVQVRSQKSPKLGNHLPDSAKP